MTKAVWKFEFEVSGEALVEMPDGAKVISVGVQCPGHICLWAICDIRPNWKKVMRTFWVRGTGHPLQIDDARERFIGTAFDRSFVWHVFGQN